MEIKSPFKVLAVQSSSETHNKMKVLKRTADVAKRVARTKVKVRKTADNAEMSRSELGGDALWIKTMPETYRMKRTAVGAVDVMKRYADRLESFANAKQAYADNKVKNAAMVKDVAEKYRKIANDAEENEPKFNDVFYTKMMQDATKCLKDQADRAESLAISAQTFSYDAIKMAADSKAWSEEFRKQHCR